MRAEDATLKSYVDSCRLGKWFEGALDLAKRSVEEEKKAEEEGKKGMEEVARRLREIEAEIEERERAVAREMLRSKPRVRGRERRVLA
jgi:nuclear pore complex protein Nup133